MEPVKTFCLAYFTWYYECQFSRQQVQTSKGGCYMYIPIYVNDNPGKTILKTLQLIQEKPKLPLKRALQ